MRLGGPWMNTVVKAGEPSDPYLIAFYDKKSLELSSDKDAAITIEIDPTGNGDWMVYRTEQIEAGKTVAYQFPESFQARWIRFVSGQDGAKVSTLLKYE